MNMEMPPINNETPTKKGDWYIFKGRKWNQKDISVIANLRRKELRGEELEKFVIECIKSGAYDDVSFPL